MWEGKSGYVRVGGLAVRIWMERAHLCRLRSHIWADEAGSEQLAHPMASCSPSAHPGVLLPRWQPACHLPLLTVNQDTQTLPKI